MKKKILIGILIIYICTFILPIISMFILGIKMIWALLLNLFFAFLSIVSYKSYIDNKGVVKVIREMFLMIFSNVAIIVVCFKVISSLFN